MSHRSHNPATTSYVLPARMDRYVNGAVSSGLVCGKFCGGRLHATATDFIFGAPFPGVTAAGGAADAGASACLLVRAVVGRCQDALCISCFFLSCFFLLIQLVSFFVLSRGASLLVGDGGPTCCCCGGCAVWWGGERRLRAETESGIGGMDGSDMQTPAVESGTVIESTLPVHGPRRPRRSI